MVALTWLPSGCTYMSKRGHDAADMFEIGVTTSREAQFAFHPIDYFNSIALGYSNVEGTYYGIGGRTVGRMPFKDKSSWGLLFWGRDNLNIGDFNPDDPHLAWRKEMKEMREKGIPLPVERPEYNKGLITLIEHDNSPPPITYVQCRRNIHLGWVGIHASLRPLDIIDFILGWTTLDILGDDGAAAPPPAKL
jgi:hypothetical protein